MRTRRSPATSPGQLRCLPIAKRARCKEAVTTIVMAALDESVAGQ
jgi:hypothetical protein